jgi:hypothetical protein
MKNREVILTDLRRRRIKFVCSSAQSFVSDDGKEDLTTARKSFFIAQNPPLISAYLNIGGSNYEGGYGIAVDSSGDAYVTGTTNSTDFPIMNPLQPANGGGFDAFMAKLNPSGSALVYSTYLGGSGDDYGYGSAVDSSGNATRTSLSSSAST